MTSIDDIQHFLVTLEPKQQKTRAREFGTDYDAAQDAYLEAERRAWGTDLDVVLLSADSLETVKRTHASYFNTSGSLAERLMSATVSTRGIIAAALAEAP
jgi:hypothetical protein